MNATASPPVRHRILFVDDETLLLQGIERSLRATRFQWECHYVDRPAAALDLLRHQPFDVVVSDMRMPEMDGVQLLATAEKISPETVRIMLTGNADLQTAIDAVNEGHIFQFLRKPCEGEQLIRCINTAIEQQRAQTSERNLLREQLSRADRLAATGRLAAGMTHDLNNILGAILMQTELELRETGPEANAREALAVIHEAATSAALLTRELNQFNRRQLIGEANAFELAPVVTATLQLLRPLLKNKISVQADLAADLPPVVGTAWKFKQALLNLLLNARDATPDGGAITVRIHRQLLTTADTKTHPKRRAGDFVCVSVTDTGVGMSAEVQQSLFEPFFTAKPGEQGLGLGLFMVHRIINELHGWLELESVPDQGTTFRIYLPTAVTPTT